MMKGNVVVDWHDGKFDIWGRWENGNKITMPFDVDVVEPEVARFIVQWAKKKGYEVSYTHAGNGHINHDGKFSG